MQRSSTPATGRGTAPGSGRRERRPNVAGYRRLPSGKWQASVRLPDGRRRTRTDPLKSVVRRWAEDLEADMRRGVWADPQDGQVTLGQWFADWTQLRVVERATLLRDASHWRTHVAPRFADVRLAALTQYDIEAWLAKMARDGVGATTRAQSLRLLRNMLGAAVTHKRIAVDPSAGVSAPRIPRHVDRNLTRQEYLALHAELPTERDRAMVSLMAFCGLRWGEVAGLHAHRVNLAAGELTVQEVLRRDSSVKAVPKSGAGQRVVPIPPHVIEEVRPFVSSGLLFPGVDYDNWRRRVFVPARERAGLADPQPTIHDLRHSYGSWLSAAGVPPRDIGSLMGHSSLRSTERYLHSGSSRFGMALRALGE